MYNKNKPSTTKINTHSLPPKTQGIPLVGVLPKLLESPDYFLEAREIYGDIYRLDIGVFRAVMLNHPDYADYVLRKNIKNYHKCGPLWDFFHTFTGNGLLVSEGDFWRQQRRTMQPYFHKKYLESLTDLMVEIIDEILTQWGVNSDTFFPLNTTQQFHYLTINIIVKVMLGSHLSLNDQQELTKAMDYVLNYMPIGSVYIRLPSWARPFSWHQYQQAVKTIYTIISNLIDYHRWLESEDDTLFSMLLSITNTNQETDKKLTNKQLCDELVSIIAGGYETTALSLTWSLHLLSQHPEVVSKIHAEIDSVLGNRLPQMADLSNLTYIQMVFQEVLRLYPIAYWLPRMALADDEIGGFFIPAKSTVITNIYTIQRHPQLWENPHEFDPERFTPERSTKRHHLAWLPFGTGKHQCIGKELALLEGKLILAQLLQRYTIHKLPIRPVKMQLAATIKPKNNMWILLEKRTQNQ